MFELNTLYKQYYEKTKNIVENYEKLLSSNFTEPKKGLHWKLKMNKYSHLDEREYLVASAVSGKNYFIILENPDRNDSWLGTYRCFDGNKEYTKAHFDFPTFESMKEEFENIADENT